MTRPKAITKEGALFDGVSCYVLDDERRVVTSGSIAKALEGDSGGVAGLATLQRRLAKLPNGPALLAALPVVEFSLPGGGTAKGIEATAIPDILQLYVDAWQADALHVQQLPVAMRAAKMLGALAKTGIVALVDEVTGYEDQRRAAELSFTYRAILLESQCQWDLMWPADFVEAMCRLRGEHFAGGAHPQWLASTYDKLYHLVLGDEVCAELKRRNPEPKFGTNHHQWLTPEAREVVRKQIPILIALAETCGSKEEFWARVEHRYARRMLQLSWLTPTRGAAE